MKFWKRKPKTPEPVKVQPVTLDILPPIDFETIDSEGFMEYLKKLTRIQMMEINDRNIIPDHLWDEYFEVDNTHKYPDGKLSIETYNSVSDYKTGLETVVKELVKQVDGIQKKVDRIVKLVENTEVTMSAKTALSM
jgi:hypothetical protein